jgi:hypothetical protein
MPILCSEFPLSNEADFLVSFLFCELLISILHKANRLSDQILRRFVHSI